MNLRNMTNDERLQLYDNELVLRVHNTKNLANERRLLAKFKPYLGQFPPTSELTKSFLTQYASRKIRTLARYGSTIKAFMKWCGEPIEDFKIKLPKSLPPYIENKEVDKLLRAIQNKTTHRKSIVRDTLLVKLALNSGMRRAELANLKPKDVHNDFLIVRAGKGGKDRRIPLTKEIAKSLGNFIRGMQPGAPVFGLKSPSISNKIKHFAKKAGLNESHTHNMRHKYATDLIEKGANVRKVQQLLGHESLATTEVYLGVTDQGLREAVDLLEREEPDAQLPKTTELIQKRQVII